MPTIVAFIPLLMLLECVLSQQPADVPLPPPTNVMVNCTDTQGTVHWQYGEEANVHFRVEVGNPKSDYKRRATKEHFYKNITARVWESLESAMDVYYVSVTAVVPGRPLFPPISTTFTYNRVKMADVKCKLDFPDVDVKADDGSAIVSFCNPLHHDPQLRHATRGAATLKFIAAYDSGAVEENSCHPHQNVCRATFPPGSSECVTLTGWVSYSGGGGLEFGPSRRACRERSSGWAMLPVVLPSVLVAATLLICVVVAVVAWRRGGGWPRPPRNRSLLKCLVVAKIGFKVASHAQVGSRRSNTHHSLRVQLISVKEHAFLILLCLRRRKCRKWNKKNRRWRRTRRGTRKTEGGGGQGGERVLGLK